MNTERDDREQIEAIRKMMAEKEEKKRAREIRKELRRKRIRAFLKDGHYFGFEVKRPVVGIRSKLQEQTARMIQAAGGTAAFVCWPEEAIREVEEYEKSQG